jgi:hypothetical protein
MPTLLELIDRLAAKLPAWDAQLCRDLLDVGEEKAALEVLIGQLAELPRVHHPALARLRELAVGTGLAETWLDLLDKTASRLSTLDLGSGTRADRGSGTRSYRDLLVDGSSLVTLAASDTIPPFGWCNAKHEVAAADHLAGRGVNPELDGGRAVLLVCGECADLGCGAVTTRVVVGDELVEWQEIGVQTNFGEGVHLVDIGPFRFAREAYMAVVHELRAGARR